MNAGITPATYEKLYNRVTKHYNDAKKVYVFDGYCGAHPDSRMKVHIKIVKYENSTFFDVNRSDLLQK